MQLRIILLLSFLTGLIGLQAQGSEKYALIIGISHFEDPQWSTLNGVKMAKEVKNTLIEKGFPEQNILLYTDKQATKQNIISAFDQLQQKVNIGGNVYIHFITHGQQVLDNDTNPREEADWLDECLVPYDCPMYIDTDKKWPPGYTGEKHLRDDEIGTLTDVLRRKLGPKGQVVVMVDACHAGTVTRAAGSHTVATPLWLGQKPPKIDARPVNKLNKTGNNQMADMAPMFSAFSMLPGEESRDSIFSSKVNLALKQSGPYTTCADFFKNIVSQVKKETTTSTPNADGLDQWGNLYLLGGGLDAPLTYFEVVSSVNPKYCELNQGQFANLFPGTEITFYPKGTKYSQISTIKKLGKGKVTTSSNFASTIELDSGAPGSNLLNTWAYVTKWKISDHLLKVKLDISQGELKDSLYNRLSKNQNFEINDVEIEVSIREDKALLRLYDQEGSLVHEFGKGPQAGDLSSDVERFLLQYQRCITLKGLSYNSEEVSVSWELYASNCEESCSPSQKQLSLSASTQQFEMVEGDCFGIKIENNSRNEVYFTLLDFRAGQFETNEDMVLIPLAGMSPQDFSIKPGGTWKSSDFNKGYCWQIEPIYGKETLKLVTSKLPVQMRQAVRTRSMTQTQEELEGDNQFSVQDIHLLVKKRGE